MTLKKLLEELKEYMNNKADVIDTGYANHTSPNKEMILLERIENEILKLNGKES